MEKLLELKKVNKIFQTGKVETRALSGLELEIYKGDFIAICGESGCGKSTLLSILGLLEQPTSGQILIKGKDATKLSFDNKAMIRNKHIGMIYQSFNLIDELTVYDNVALPLKYRGMKKKEIAPLVNKYLDMVGLTHRINHMPSLLSGGQQQRVAIARALVGEPDILLVDEATGNLDSKVGSEIMNIICELNANDTTVCMVTHETKYADMAKTKLYLKDGQLLRN